MGDQISIVNEVSAEKWVYGGDALSRTEGQVVLTPFILPGETARVEPVQERPGLIKTKLLEVVSESPRRVTPPCPYFGACGGCHYQEADYEFQVEQKAAILREQLLRVGKIEYSEDIRTLAGPPLGYRNRTQLHVEGTKIGYFQAGSHTLLPVEICPISSPKINDALKALREMARERPWPQFIREIEIFTNETQTLLNVATERPLAKRFFEWVAERIPGADAAFVDYKAGPDLFRVSHNSFFQVNRHLLEPLVEAALGDAKGKRALDLYAGVGLFSLPLARRFESVFAVESGKSAVRDLELNAECAGLKIGSSSKGVEHALPSITETPDFVLADPPRQGLAASVTRDLIRLRAARIVLVSCDPATLARDLNALCGAGYGIDSLLMADLFPQTFHIETVAHLSLR